MKFDLEDLKSYADKHRGKNVTSGPHWPIVIRYPILFDLYAALLRENERLKVEVDKHRWIPVAEKLPEDDGALINENIICF